MLPQEGVGCWTPTPRKLSDASATMAAPRAAVGNDQEGRHALREHVEEQHPRRCTADGPRRLHVGGDRDGQRLGPDDARDPRRLRHAQGQDDALGRRAPGGDDGQREDEGGKRQQRVHQPLQRPVDDAAAVVAADKPHTRADGSAQGHGQEPHGQGEAGAVGHPAEDVPPQVVRPQGMLQARRGQGRVGVDGPGVRRDQHRSGQGENRNQEQ